MKVWQILIGICMFLATIAGATAGSYYYSFDSNIEGIKTFDVESYSTSFGSASWSSNYGGSLQMYGGASGTDVGIGNTTQFFDVGDKLVVNFVLDEAFNTSDEIGIHFAFCNESYTGAGLDIDSGCTQTYRYNSIALTNQSGNTFYDDDIYHYVFAKPIDSFDDHYYRLEINRLDALMFDFSILDRNNSYYYFTVFNLSDKIGNNNYWFAFGGMNSGAGDGWYIFVQDMNLTGLITNCTEDWAAYYVNQSCNVSDFLPEQKLYLDLNFCNTTGDLPLDNGTIVNVYGCNYCSEDINEHFTSWGECVLSLQDRIRYYIDDNFASCCGVTNISTDCDINNGSFVNASEQQACSERYSSGDLAPILADGMGTAAASFVGNMDFFIALLAVLGVVAIATLMVTKFKR